MTNSIKNALSVTAVAAFLFMAFASSNSGDKKDDTKKDSTATTAAAEEKDSAKANWEYSEETDKMTDKKMYFATTTSTNKVDFKFPYDGGSEFYITVRNMGDEDGNEIILQVSKGQFMISTGDESVKVRFDNEKAEEYTYTSAADGDHELIFLQGSEAFLKKLKKAKKVMIECAFYEASGTIMEFNTEGLKWER